MPYKSECQEWTKGRNARGYGRATATQDAHRYVYEQAHGPIPKGRHLHHTCGNVGCVNLDHLEVLTPREHRQRHLLTHCRRGHELTEENTRIYPNGTRHCRTCLREYDRRRRAVQERETA